MSKLKDTLNGIFFGRRLNEKGQEVPANKPPALPVGYKRPPSLEERMQTMIRGAMSLKAQADGYESFEEANDFNVEDDADANAFLDEDEEFAGNDPFVKEAAEREKARLIAKASKKAKEAPKGPSRQPTPSGSESRSGDNPTPRSDDSNSGYQSVNTTPKAHIPT